MISALYVERASQKTTYAIDAAEAAQIFRASGIQPEAVKEIGTSQWTRVISIDELRAKNISTWSVKDNKEIETMTIQERIANMAERDEQNRQNTNKMIDKFKMAYEVMDSEGNRFVWAGVASGGFPLYRGRGGSKHIFSLNGLTVIRKYA